MKTGLSAVGLAGHRAIPAAVAILAGIIAGQGTGIAAEETIRPAFATKLPNVPGRSLTALLVTYPPGGKSAKHHHAGSVYAYVLSGAIRSQNSATGPVRVYKAGESFFEPPGSTHLISENASTTEPASLLAIFVAEDGAALKTDER